jgi:O-antigen ligase
LGYGFVGIGPGSNNSNFHWEHDDLTNIYIHILARAGLVALIPFLVINYLYYRRLYQAARYTTTYPQQWMLWCFGAALVGWNISMMTVSALDQVETLLFMFIALCANLPPMMRQALRERQAELCPSANMAVLRELENEIWAVRMVRQRHRRMAAWRRRWRWIQRFGFPRMKRA